MLDNLLKLLDGKKTYVAAACLLVLALLNVQSDPTKAAEYFSLFLGLLGLRHAIEKTK